MKRYFLILFLLLILLAPSWSWAQELYEPIRGVWSARVIEIVSQERRLVPGTDTETILQTIRAELLDGERQGETVVVENDFLKLKRGDKFFLSYLITIDGQELFTVREVDRRLPLVIFIALFAAVVIYFGGWQGLRALLSLAGSLLVVVYILLPNLLAGYSPIWISTGVAAVILFCAIYLTHGFGRESSAAFIGTVLAVIFTGLLATWAVSFARLSGFVDEEAVYLNMVTSGQLNFQGLLLGAIIIGALGALDDIAITQAMVVRELYGAAPTLSRLEIYQAALRVGKEHVGALVNTLALAYAGAALPLLLFFSTTEMGASYLLNQEVLATEIVRTVIGSIGLILAVPLSTALAVFLLAKTRGIKTGKPLAHKHHH